MRIQEHVYLSQGGDPAHRLIVPDARVVASLITREKKPAPVGTLTIAKSIAVVEMADLEIHESRLEIRDCLALGRGGDRSAEPHQQSGWFPWARKLPAQATGNARQLRSLDRNRPAASRHQHVQPFTAAGTAYQVYLSRRGQPRKGFIWPMPLQECLPVIGVPLREPHADVPVNLQAAFEQVYARCEYDLDLDHQEPPPPPLSSADRDWVQEQCRRTLNP